MRLHVRYGTSADQWHGDLFENIKEISEYPDYIDLYGPNHYPKTRIMLRNVLWYRVEADDEISD